MPPVRVRAYRFGEFWLDESAYELRRNDRPVRLERRPMELLMWLVERHGELITRDEIVARLWGREVFIDIDASVNTVIRKIRRALNDSADDVRFVQTVQGKGYRFVADVELVGVAAVLAVLPFQNLQRDPDQDYIADGLTEETIASLGQIGPERLSVIGRTSSMSYRGTAKSIADIGRELNADYLLEGSVRVEAGHYRVTATLIRARDQVHIWSDTYHRESKSLLGLQAELGRGIAREIHLRLSPPDATIIGRPHTQDRRAYDLYLRGRYYYNQMTLATADRALDCFREATVLDPTYALAWTGIADTCSSRLLTSDVRPSDVLSEARSAAAHAMTSAIDVAEAHTSVAGVQFLFDWDWRSAETHLRRALSLNPSSAQAYWLLGHALSLQSRHDDAAAAASRALELDPLDALTHSMAAQIAFCAGRMQVAAAHAKAAVHVGPEFWVGYWQLAQAYEQTRRTDEVLDLLAHAVRLSNGNSKPMSLSAYVHATAQNTTAASDIVTELERRSRDTYVPPVAVALGYLGLNEHDCVFDWLERAVAARDVHLIYLHSDPKWRVFKRDERFQDLLRRCG
jgi:TolB-like protein